MKSAFACAWLPLILLQGLCGKPVLSQDITAARETPQAGPAILSSIIIERRNIFDEDAAAAWQLVNRLHSVTRESVIQREIWLQPGDPITEEDAQELERNLRQLDLFARVRVSLLNSESQAGSANLLIETTDRLSIVASAGASFLGGIGEVKFAVGEKNLLGLGHQLQIGYSENTEGELLGSIAYDNVLIGSNDIYAGISLGQTEEGEFATATLSNRFLNFNDNRFWKIELERKTSRVDIFDSGESVAEVPRANEKLELQWQNRSGRPDQFLRVGPVLNLQQTRYEAPIGIQAQTIERPDDTTSLFAGAFLAIDSNLAFQRLTGLDTLSFEQDVTLGYSAQILAGVEHRTTASTDSTLPVIFVRGSSTRALTSASFFNTAIDSFASIDNDSLPRWSVTTAATAFNTRLKNQTLAARVKYKSAFDSDGLAPQQTLGEASGLRGYPAREFNGEQSLLVNLEHRWQTPITIARLELGTVAFADAGWIGDRGNSNWLDDAMTSVGVGIRIGSPQLLGSGVIRVDLAFALGDAADVYDPSFSLSLGQVFEFKP